MDERERIGAAQLSPRGQQLFDSVMLAESNASMLPRNTTGMEWRATISPPQHDLKSISSPGKLKTKTKINGKRN